MGVLDLKYGSLVDLVDTSPSPLPAQRNCLLWNVVLVLLHGGAPGWTPADKELHITYYMIKL